MGNCVILHTILLESIQQEDRELYVICFKLVDRIAVNGRIRNQYPAVQSILTCLCR